MTRVLWSVLLAAASLLAQTSRGTVAGTVTDSSGASIMGAAVTLMHTATGITRATVSNDVGFYRFDAVDLGVYEVKVSKEGFQSVVLTAVGVQPNATTTLDAALQPGIVAESVTVNAETADLLTKDGPLRGGAFGPGEVSRLPLSERKALLLAATLPGVVRPAGAFPNTFDNSVGFSVNGQRPRANNSLLDGTDNNHGVLSGNQQPFTMTDAVEVFSAQTSNFGVEFGRSGGGVFNVITRSGTNDFHGTAHWQYRSQRFQSLSNLDRLNGTPKPVVAHNVFGFTLGGPVRRNRTFFFGGIQQDRARMTSNFRFTLPTAGSVARLRSLFPNNPRLDLYLETLGDLRGSAAPFAWNWARAAAACSSDSPPWAFPRRTRIPRGWPGWTTTSPRFTACLSDTSCSRTSTAPPRSPIPDMSAWTSATTRTCWPRIPLP